MSTIPIQIDPFFDGAGDQYPSGPASQMQRPASTYRDASSETFETTDLRGLPTASALAGRPVTSVLRPQVRGMNMGGTIIPHATVGGTPEGFSPNVLDDVEVVIDPHISGQRARLRIGDLTEAAIQHGQQMADEAVPQPQNAGARRFKASAAYHGMAQFMGGNQPLPVQADQEFVDDAPLMSQQHVPQQHVKRAAAPARVAVMSGHRVSADPPVARSAGSPMSLLRKPQAPAPVPVVHVEVPAQRALVRVNFEIDLELANGAHHNHSWSAKYHDVAISTLDETGKPYSVSFLWDNTAEDEPYVPPSGDDSPEMAMEIVGQREVYLVRALPFQYKSLLDGRFQQIQFLVLRVAST